jgi:hypothetical protein
MNNDAGRSYPQMYWRYLFNRRCAQVAIKLRENPAQ